MTLIDTTFERSLDRLVQDHAADEAGTRLELWVFETEAYRRAAERSLRERGIEARARSAYKPLLHFFLEEVDRAVLSRVRVAYPVLAGCPADRFLLETYPLSALLSGVELAFSAQESEIAEYVVSLDYADGRSEEHRVFAPNRSYVDHIGETVFAPTGWIKRSSAAGTEIDEAVRTEYEAIYALALKTVADRDWGETEPFFPALVLRVALPAEDVPLPVGEESISLREALHEDLYFSLLEFFQKKTGRPVSDRRIRPGQIVPEISAGPTPSLRIEIGALSAVEADGPRRSLDTASAPLTAVQVHAELGMIAGLPFEVRSYAGRPVTARYRKGSDAAVMISGGQHANETSGVVGALRAARELSLRAEAHFTVAPLENPDGYALHRSLCEENPRHMHHAARYTALGNDLEYQSDEASYERGIRIQALALSGAKLHVNLHGYPSHEWTRPLSGYIPRGFASWMLPHGFFLVLRHHAAWAERAERLVQSVTARLNAVPGLRAFTDEQLRLYSIHAGAGGFRLVNGFPCQFTVEETSTIPLRLITEYPDETIGGDAFIAGHTTQMETVLAAYDAYQVLVAETDSKKGFDL